MAREGHAEKTEKEEKKKKENKKMKKTEKEKQAEKGGEKKEPFQYGTADMVCAVKYVVNISS